MPSNKFKTKFPPARIKKIMQTDEEVGKVAAAVPVIVSKSLELFTEIFLRKSGQIATGRGARTLSIDHIKECVDTEQKFDFLREIVTEAAAKAIGKSGEEAPPGGSLPVPVQSDGLANGTKETSRSTPKTDFEAIRQSRKRAKGAGPMGAGPGLPSSSSTPGSSSSSSSSSRNQPSISSTSVITKVEKKSVPVKKEYSWLKTETNEADDEGEGEGEELTKRRKRSRLSSVVDGLVVLNPETPFSGKEKKAKLHSPSSCFVEGAKKSGMPQSVIVKRDMVDRSQSQSDEQAHSRQSYVPETSNAKFVPSSGCPSVPPTTMQFMYANSPSLYSSSVMGYPTGSPVEATNFPYTPQAMMMMMQHQQEAREAFQYQMYAQHEQQRQLEESSARLPTTYPCPRDFFSSENPGRSVIVPTAEAQDLRINRPVDTLTHGQRYQSYHGDRDGPY